MHFLSEILYHVFNRKRSTPMTRYC